MGNTVTVKIEADVAEFNEAMERAEQAVDRLTEKLERLRELKAEVEGD